MHPLLVAALIVAGVSILALIFTTSSSQTSPSPSPSPSNSSDASPSSKLNSISKCSNSSSFKDAFCCCKKSIAGNDKNLLKYGNDIIKCCTNASKDKTRCVLSIYENIENQEIC